MRKSYQVVLSIAAFAAIVFTSKGSTSALTRPPAAQVAVVPVASTGNITQGKIVYGERCAICHNAGGMGPSLKGERRRKDQAATAAWIENPKPPMPKLYPSPLSERDVNDVAAYVQTFSGTPEIATKIAATGSDGNVAKGKALYGESCAGCHGATGTEGGTGPSLKGEKSRKNLAAAIAWIEHPAAPMPKLYPSPLGEKEVNAIAAYVETL